MVQVEFMVHMETVRNLIQRACKSANRILDIYELVWKVRTTSQRL